MSRAMVAVLLATTGCIGDVPEVTGPEGPRTPRSLVIARQGASVIGGTAYSSSTRLMVSWAAPSGGAERYLVTRTDLATSASATVELTQTATVFVELKSATRYRIDVAACSATECFMSDAATADAETPGEVWQLQGSGNAIAGLARIVPDGNVKLHVLRYGTGSPNDLLGRLVLYYGPLPQNTKGLAPAITPASVNAATPSTYLSFTSRAGTGGLLNPSSAAPLVRQVNTGQGVPLSFFFGGGIRLYFEATGSDNRTRILYLNSRDEYAGMDFNSGPSTVCSSQPDYSPGGGCAPTVAIGVEGDAVAPNARIQNARQFKIGVPTMKDWRWDGEQGTFMVFTTDAIPGCSTATPNQGYAVWSGTAWQVQYETSTGCPRLFRSMQAAHPLHLGDARFKLYYGDPSDQTGRVAGSSLPFLGPKKLLYADGARTGNAQRVDFEDWEPTDAARKLTFLWPDGTTLNSTALGYIDDFSVITPTGSLALQVLYVAITDGTVVPFAAAAVLINP